MKMYKERLNVEATYISIPRYSVGILPWRRRRLGILERKKVHISVNLASFLLNYKLSSIEALAFPYFYQYTQFNLNIGNWPASNTWFFRVFFFNLNQQTLITEYLNFAVITCWCSCQFTAQIVSTQTRSIKGLSYNWIRRGICAVL